MPNNSQSNIPSVILWSILCAMRPQPDQYAVQGITVEDSMSLVHLVWHEAPVLTASPPGIAEASFPDTATPWEEYAADYNRLRD